MSFISVIKAIGKDALKVLGIGLTAANTIETAAEPIVLALDPAAGAILGKVQQVTASLEQMITTEQQGALKGQTAVQILQEEIPQLQAVITATGSGYQLPQAQAQALVNASVALYNALATVIAGFKPPATTTTTAAAPKPAA